MEVIFYKTAAGNEPAKDFILKLAPKMRAKIARTIKLLEDNGIALREPYSKSLGHGIFELRIRIATDAVRVLYFFYVGDIAVLTNGFIKKTQHTPPEILKLAQSYQQDFFNRQIDNDNI